MSNDISVSPDEFDANFSNSLSDLFEFGPAALDEF